MALFSQKNPLEDVKDLRAQGLTDSVIMEELTKKGHRPEAIHMAISQMDSVNDFEDIPSPPPQYAQHAGYGGSMGGGSFPSGSSLGGMGGSSSVSNNIYERIEEITEGLINEKWDDLVAEMKKLVDWKEKMEETQRTLANDVAKLKEDFKLLHQGVLGKLETYDKRMTDVGTELQAVGKVFKDVIPEFVENVKELKHITQERKKK